MHENHRLILPKPAFPTQMRIFITHARPGGCGGDLDVAPSLRTCPFCPVQAQTPTQLVPSLVLPVQRHRLFGVCWESRDKGALKIPHSLINATCLSRHRLCGLLIIFIKKIISPNQGRSSPELQLINCSHISLFYKKSCGTDENYRPSESALNTNSDSVTVLLPSTASTWLG